MKKKISTNQLGVKLLYPFLVFTICVFSNCENEELVGLEVQPDDAEVGYTTIDTLSLEMVTERAEPIRTDISGDLTMQLGSMVDPEFGYSEAGFVTELRMETEGADFGDVNQITLDSAVLTLVYAGGYFQTDGDLTPQSFKVYQLDNTIDLDSNYFSDYTLPGGLTLIGEANQVSPNLEDSVNVGGDNEPPMLRIRLDDAWALSLLQAGYSIYSSQESMKDFLKGLVIVPDNPNQPAGEGAILQVNPLDRFSRLKLWFGTETDPTETFEFLINSSSEFFAFFNQDYSGFPVGNALDNEPAADENIYIQSMQGTHVRLRIPHLLDLGESLGDVIINKAELIVHVDANHAGNYQNHSRLLMRFDSANLGENFPPVEDLIGFSSQFDGAFDGADNVYRMNITRHIQEVLVRGKDGENINFDLIILASGASVNASRTLCYGLDPMTGNGVEFNLTYTPLD